jgi:hypothetical protein
VGPESDRMREGGRGLGEGERGPGLREGGRGGGGAPAGEARPSILCYMPYPLLRHYMIIIYQNVFSWASAFANSPPFIPGTECHDVEYHHPTTATAAAAKKGMLGEGAGSQEDQHREVPGGQIVSAGGNGRGGPRS